MLLPPVIVDKNLNMGFLDANFLVQIAL